MGFRPPCDVFRLRFEDGRYAGLEVVCREGTVDAYEQLSGVPEERERSAEALATMCQAFAPVLVEWNLEDPVTGLPTPPTLDGLRSHTITTVAAIVGAWLDAVLRTRQPDPGQPAEVDVDELEQQLLAASTTA